MFYRLKIITPTCHDFDGPLHPNKDSAIKAAMTMLAIHPGQIYIEIHQLANTSMRKGEVVWQTRREGKPSA